MGDDDQQLQAADEAARSRKLTPEEDEALRRLHFFERLGAQLAPPLDEVKEEIRSRDRRTEIREPHDPLATPQVPPQPGTRR